MMMLDKDQEKMALKALLKSLMAADEEGEEDAAGEYVEGRRESSVTPEKVEGELYDEKEGVREDAEETLGGEEEEGDEEETPVSLRDLVASFMEGEEDPFADKKALPARGGSVEIEVTKEGAMPAKDLAKKVLGYKKKNKRKGGM